MTNATLTASRATLADLYREEGKAELIGGRIVRFMASGMYPSRIGFRIAMKLESYSVQIQKGQAFPDGIGYAVPELPSGRESFSPDASLYFGPLPKNRMRFIQGVPIFAAEVRSENDYGAAAEEEMAAKRADYFVAGTLVVWDVDPIAETIAIYHADKPTQPVVLARGATANAEPALPGWQMEVDEVFNC